MEFSNAFAWVSAFSASSGESGSRQAVVFSWARLRISPLESRTFARVSNSCLRGRGSARREGCARREARHAKRIREWPGSPRRYSKDPPATLRVRERLQSNRADLRLRPAGAKEFRAGDPPGEFLFPASAEDVRQSKGYRLTRPGQSAGDSRARRAAATTDSRAGGLPSRREVRERGLGVQ